MYSVSTTALLWSKKRSCSYLMTIFSNFLLSKYITWYYPADWSLDCLTLVVTLLCLHDRVRLVNNTITMLTAPVRERGLPWEHIHVLVTTREDACVSKISFNIFKEIFWYLDLHKTIATGMKCCIFLVFISFNIMALLLKYLFSVNWRMIPFETYVGKWPLWRPGI